MKKTSGLLAGSALLLVMTTSVIAWSSWQAASNHHLVLVARDMAFYIQGDQESNPTLTLPTNTRVTIELRNEDAGIIHDLLVQSIEGVRTDALKGGQSGHLTFQTPPRPTETDYLCTFHGQTMRGRLRFE